MTDAIPPRLQLRKAPIQARSEATLEAIREGAIQVLLADGLSRLTTTRVAARAGVSVGTLYQYFPNKEALLFALLRRHFEALADAIERACAGDERRPLDDVADAIADAYVSVKVARPDATAALYRAAGSIDQFKLPVGIYERLETAAVRALENASDVSFADHKRVVFTLLSALAGLSRGSFSDLASGPDTLDRFRQDATRLARAYLRAAVD
ncbi:TetR/AcrR family transcriptional regulator [Acuticoccus kandeliae]|uniref:TetR/AcrR family transcriptional regulator n=1 Tax=Acuticoccus kandeliae TaxID=2073160 RepID=UPI000D3E4453|nr:TetR/AcrR family transcriptional regulator [Acuticoccus kandeliae]